MASVTSLKIVTYNIVLMYLREFFCEDVKAMKQ